jgi:hypothetical protein
VGARQVHTLPLTPVSRYTDLWLLTFIDVCNRISVIPAVEDNLIAIHILFAE